MANLRAVNETYQLDYNSQPRPAYVSLRIQPRTPDSDEPYNQLPAGEHHFISIYGFTPGFAFTDGEWVAEVVTQYTPNSRPYKQPRYGTLTFLVR